MAEEPIFIEPSAAGPTQKIGADGVVKPGKAHEARPGKVSNPGVRTVGTAATAPRCPQCGNASLKMRMNRKAGQRIYCTVCPYDQANQDKNAEVVNVNPGTKIVTSRGRESGGVKIVKQTGPR